MYLVGPDGEFVDYFGKAKTAEQVVEGVTKHMQRYDSIKAWTEIKTEITFTVTQ